MNLYNELARHLTKDEFNKIIGVTFGTNPFNPEGLPDKYINNVIFPELLDREEEDEFKTILTNLEFTEQEAYKIVPPLMAWSRTHILFTSFVTLPQEGALFSRSYVFFIVLPRHPRSFKPEYGLTP